MDHINTISILNLQSMEPEKLEKTISAYYNGKLRLKGLFSSGVPFMEICRQCLARQLMRATESDIMIMLDPDCSNSSSSLFGKNTPDDSTNTLANWRRIWDIQ
jgi:hypothetical protein